MTRLCGGSSAWRYQISAAATSCIGIMAGAKHHGSINVNDGGVNISEEQRNIGGSVASSWLAALSSMAVDEGGGGKMAWA